MPKSRACWPARRTRPWPASPPGPTPCATRTRRASRPPRNGTTSIPRPTAAAATSQRDCPDGNCVVGAIEKQLAILSDQGQPVEARRDALKFVVHFVGDVHQPLHATNHTDAGGN